MLKHVASFIAQSQVFLMDPWWNPAVERKPQARINGLGQNKPTSNSSFHLKLK
jgi:hypothetical protein